MKRLIVTAVGTMALLAGTAYAGGAGGCVHGELAYSSGADEKTPVLAAADETDPKVLAKLKKLDDTEALLKLIETPVMHN